MKALLTVLALVAVGLAGCADDGGAGVDSAAAAVVDREEFQLAAGKGAIAGLLVDDRFRPIDLEDSPEAESQFTGFILLQETGEQVQTNQEGEFSFVDLEPGTYTIRVNADGHEAVPQKVRVEEGLFNEASIVARRILSEGSTIVTEEYTGFAACGIAVGVTTVITNCIDTSGESDRRGTSINFTAYTDATYMIVEVRVDEPGNWEIEVSGEGRDPQYGSVDIVDDVWAKRIYEVGGTYGDQNPNAWENDQDVETIIFFGGDIDNPVGPVPTPVGSVNNFDLGAAVGKRVRMMFSVFVGEPEVDLEAYQILTDDAT